MLRDRFGLHFASMLRITHRKATLRVGVAAVEDGPKRDRRTRAGGARVIAAAPRARSIALVASRLRDVGGEASRLSRTDKDSTNPKLVGHAFLANMYSDG